MKANFNEQGALIISAESNVERMALKSWNEGFTPDFSVGCESMIVLDYESYLNKGELVSPKPKEEE